MRLNEQDPSLGDGVEASPTTPVTLNFNMY